ncbi:hypothetical protein AB4480_18625 [Vibrio sp. 10N.261.45.A4]|uniref:hypothetical protein n=1 Tax=Vibrio sp. 10N.261.45.A4 TaxID=3229655 RepID=UPI00354B2F47
MAQLGMCDINNMKLSKKSKRAVQDIKEALDRGMLLSGLLAATPFYNIFATPGVSSSAFETLVNIREHDWDTFVKAMHSSNSIVRGVIFNIANEREVFTYGEEQKFWSCVSQAAK